MKDIKLCGLGNALVDIFLDVSEENFSKLGFERSSMRLVSAEEQNALIKQLSPHEQLELGDARRVSGGSVANSIVAFSQLGGKAAFLSSVGDDELGRFYRSEFSQLGIHFPSIATPTTPTGTCVALITPDAERTMRTCLGATAFLGTTHLDRKSIERSEWLFIEGYVLSNPELGQAAVREALEIAKASGTKIALTCSEAWVIQGFRAAVDETVSAASLVFANEAEAIALTGCGSAKDSFEALCKKIPNVVVTMGAEGALIKWGTSSVHVPATQCQPRDLTGAGDMLAGAFLAGVLDGASAMDAGKRATMLASRVISQIGARLSSVD
jgi:sugar/nucleoside kinase (ribokinase family)